MIAQTLTLDNIKSHLDRTYAGVKDFSLPSREEINLLFPRFGVITDHLSRPNGFSIILEDKKLSSTTEKPPGTSTYATAITWKRSP